MDRIGAFLSREAALLEGVDAMVSYYQHTPLIFEFLVLQLLHLHWTHQFDVLTVGLGLRDVLLDVLEETWRDGTASSLLTLFRHWGTRRRVDRPRQEGRARVRAS